MRNLLDKLLIEVNTMNHLNQRVNDLLKQKEEYEGKVKLATDADKLAKLAKSYKIESRKQFILNVINQALHIVFGDKYQIDIVIDESKTSSRYNIVYKLVLYKNGVEIATNAELYTTTGGGVITIISFIMKIILGYINTGNKFFILDEVFSQVSERYRPGIAKLLRILSDQYGFTFFIISHDKLEQEDVDLVYQASLAFDENNIPLLNLELVHKRTQDILDDNYYYVEIENFQSIKKEKVFIKGVTVVYGDSDSGKSAIQRAISSIILNDFKPNSYPRWRKKGSKKVETKIKFAKVFNKSEEFIELTYKDVVKYRTHTGEEFTGKKLAAENIEKILESFGFAKIDTSNLTNELKEQVKRIYITTQYDKLFLPEERNGIEKILTILFESQIYNDVISAINSDILEINKKLKEIHYELDELKQKLIKQQITVLQLSKDVLFKLKESELIINKIADKIKSIDESKDVATNIINELHQLNLVNKIKSKQKQSESLHHKINTVDKIKNQIEEILGEYNKLQLLNKLVESSENVSKINDSINVIDSQTNIIHDILNLSKAKKYFEIKQKSIQLLIQEKIAKLNYIKAFLEKYQQMILTKNQIENKILSINNTTNSIQDDLNNLKALSNELNLLQHIKKSEEKYAKINEQINIIQDEINELPDKIGVHICPTCNGKGYIE